MTDLADFLLARIAEDEQIARTAADYDSDSEGGHWFADGGSIGPGKTPGWYQFEYVGAEHAEHMAHWDPARALAECDARRRIVEFHKSWPVLVEQQPELAGPAAGLNDMTFRMTQQIAWATQEEYLKRFGEESPTTPMLRALALPYADHPDWREEWRA